jgi:hypothetical protein
MPSTAGATQATATVRREMLQRMLQALDAYHAAEQTIDDGRDPATGADLADSAAKTVALDAAASGLTLGFHAAIDRAWTSADATARQTLWGGAEPTTQARRVLESETARQKAFASRFALDVARGETEEGRKIPEGTRAAMYAEASEAGYQIGASLNSPDGTLIWWVLAELSRHCYLCPIHAANSPYTRESIPSSPRDGSTPCKTRCKCHLTFSPATGTGPIDPESTEKARPFTERIVNPPPVPPGLRLPTPEERAVMRDREIQLNFARRKAADAEDAGRRAEADLWYQKRKDLNAEAIAYANERKIHDVPTFRVGDVINGRDLGQRDIDRLTHFRGIDGVTVSRAQVAAIKEAVAAAKRNVLTQLSQYPDIDAVSREEWRQALRDNGAPASAFGGELFRLGRESTEHACDHADHGPMRVRQRPVLDTLRAIEAAVPTVSDATLPSPADIQVLNIVGETARETLQNHLVALEVLAAAGRRTGVNPYRVELGPMDGDWPDTVAVAGTWVQGEMSEVRRFLTALRESAPAGFAVASWQPMG